MKRKKIRSKVLAKVPPNRVIPDKRRKYVLSELLDQITPENKHELVDCADVGKEIY